MTSPNVPTRSPLRALLLILVIAVLAILVLVLAFRAGRRAHVEDEIRTSCIVHRASCIGPSPAVTSTALITRRRSAEVLLPSE